MKTCTQFFSRRLTSTALALTMAAMTSAASGETFKLQEATISDIAKAMDAGALSSVELTVLYLNRIAAYDRHGPRLNAIPVLNDDILRDATVADDARRAGKSASLLGIPYTVKDSYKVKGMTVAAGSPAFASLIAQEDAFTVSRIRGAGGVLIGRTNMPPLANGGMQKGVYGRAESPYNPDYLAAAWASGSSNGSGVSTGSNMAVFGMGEETVSSGRSPASNNAVVAYTPSRGMLSIRGNWPLFPTRDVVVPHTRTVGDMLRVLNVISVDDPVTAGDFWRDQKVVKLPTAASVRPADFTALATPGALRGKRIGVPTMYIGKDATLGRPITVRPSILALWQKAADALRALGAEVVEVDFPVMHNYEADRLGAKGPIERGLMPQGWFRTRPPEPGSAPTVNYEMAVLVPYVAEQFVRLNGDPKLPSWTAIDPDKVFPTEPGGMEAQGLGFPHGYRDFQKAIAGGLPDPATLPGFAQSLEGAETLRKIDFEQWMQDEKLDLVVFPAAADVGRANANMDRQAYEDANRNGVFFSNMNHAIRHLGIPSVSVPMGQMADIGMPINLTFIGAAYSDPKLLAYAFDYEQATLNRRPPSRTPALDGEVVTYDPARLQAPARRADKSAPTVSVKAASRYVSAGSKATLTIDGTVADAGGVGSVKLFVNGRPVPVSVGGSTWRARYVAQASALADPDLMLVVLAKDNAGNAGAAMTHYAVAADGALTRLAHAPLPPCDICAAPETKAN